MQRIAALLTLSACCAVTGTTTAALQFGGGTLYDPVVVIRKNAPLMTGTQDFTSSKMNDFDAAIFLVSGASADGTEQFPARVSVGVCDDSLEQYSIARRVENGNTSMQSTITNASDDYAIVISDPTSDLPHEGYAEAVEVLPNGIRLDWVDAPSAAYEVTCILIGGSGNLAFVDAHQATGNPYTYSQAPFEADAYFFAGLDSAVNDDVSRFEFSFGFAANHSPIEQASIGYNFPHNVTTTNGLGIVSATTAISIPKANATLVSMEVTDFTSNGFVANNTGGANFVLVGVAFSGSDVHVTTHDVAATTGQQAFTTGMRPHFVLTASSLLSAYDTLDQTSAAGSFGLSAFTNAKESSLSMRNKDAIAIPPGVTATSSYSDSMALALLDHLGSEKQNATLYSMDDTGFTLDFSTADVAGKLIALSIEKPTVP